MMRTLVESLKRLYKDKRITKTKIGNIKKTGKLSKEEQDHIIGG